MTTVESARALALTSLEARNSVLRFLHDELLANKKIILQANEKDVKRKDPNDPLLDRLLLTEKRIEGMSSELMTVIGLPDPLGKVLEEYVPPSGIQIKKVSVPIGVIAVIYESRPNVTIDVASLCLKSGNSVILRGGSDAYETNRTLTKLIQVALKKAALPTNSVTLLDPDRKKLEKLVRSHDQVDVIIPRGGASLIKWVRENATVPVIETGASVVHTFVDESADPAMACRIILNEKTRRPSVCNAVDTILIHEQCAKNFLPKLATTMLPSETLLHTDQKSYSILKACYPKKLLKKDARQHFATEFLSLEMNVRLVPGIDEALRHIRTYSLKHSESIVTRDEGNARRFQEEVDAACVYVNTSTAFSDGAQFGLGSEIGISTQKLHARGPMGLEALTSYKWLITSAGKIRK